MSESDFFEQPDSSAPSTESAAAPKRGALDDPVVRRLALIGAGMLILWLAGILSALVFGLLTPSDVPRTSAERSLMVYEQALEETTSVDPLLWADYAKALTEAKQYSRAQSVINNAMKAVKTKKSAVMLEQTRLYVARGDWSKALEWAKKTETEIQKEIDKDQKALDAQGIVTSPETPRAKKEVYLIKADALIGQKDDKAAIAAYDEHLEFSPTSADVYVMRGDLKADAGDKSGAEADYRECLKYIPDFQPAIDGLEKIGAAR